MDRKIKDQLELLVIKIDKLKGLQMEMERAMGYGPFLCSDLVLEQRGIRYRGDLMMSYINSDLDGFVKRSIEHAKKLKIEMLKDIRYEMRPSMKMLDLEITRLESELEDTIGEDECQIVK